MDACAELTLRIVRLVQEHHNPRSSLAYWFFFPEFRKATWTEAREILTAAPKPLLVAPLMESGALATWSISRLESDQRVAAEQQFANQQEYFSEKLRPLQLGDADSIRLDTPAGNLDLLLPDFQRWVRDYAISVGISVNRDSDSRVGRLIIRPPGGGRPLGM